MIISKKGVIILGRLIPMEAEAIYEKPSRSSLKGCSDALSHVTRSNDQSIMALLSMGSLFALISLGAKGETRNQLAQFFGLGDDASLLGELGELVKLFEKDEAVQNFYGFYVRGDYPLTEGFQKMLSQFGDVRNVSFNEDDRKGINTLVEEKTGGMIKDFISNPFDPELRILLLNTILCKMKFRSPFYEWDTKEMPFTRLDGSKVNVNLMYHNYDDDFSYAELDSCQVMELDCNRTRCKFGIILPRPGVPLEVVQNLDPSRIPLTSNWEVDFYLPRFTIEKEWDFVDLLKKTGLELPFSNGADFTGVNEKDGMYISMAIQKAKIEVDEKGATAAAASALGGRCECCIIRDGKKVEMRCDRTFCGYIRSGDHVLFRFTFDGK